MKKKLKIIIPIVVLVVLIAVGAALYFFTDLFKSPKKLFYKYMSKTFQSEKEYTYDNFLEELDFYYNKACKTTAEVTVDGNLENSGVSGLEDLKDLKLSLLSEVGPKQEEAYTKIGLDYKNDNLTSIEFLNSNNNYGLNCSDIYKDYFYIENDNLKDLVEKLGADSSNVPDSISKINVYDLLYISKDARKSIYNKYYKIIDSELDKDSFSSEKGVEIKVNDKKVKADSYTLTLTAKDLSNILSKTFETLKDDDETLDLFLEKYKMIAGDIEGAEISKDDIKDLLENAIESFEDADTSSLGKIEITVYEVKGKTVKLTIKSGDEVIGLDLTANKNDGIMNFYVESDDEIVLSVKNDYTVNGDTTKGKITLNSEGSDMMNIDYTFVDSKSKCSLDAKLTLNNSDENIAIEFKYEVTGDNLDKKPTKYDFNGYVKLVEDATDSDSDYMSIQFKGTTEYTDSIDIPNLGKSNGVCINTVTDAELETIKTDVNTNLNTFMDKILNKFGLTRTDAGMPEGSVDFFQALENATTNLNTTITPSTNLQTVSTPTLNYNSIDTSALKSLDTSSLTF